MGCRPFSNTSLGKIIEHGFFITPIHAAKVRDLKNRAWKWDFFPSLKVDIETWVTWISDPEFFHCWGQNIKRRWNFVLFQSPCALWAIHSIIQLHSENTSAEFERQPVALIDSPFDTLKMLVNALIRLVFAGFWKKKKRKDISKSMTVCVSSKHSCSQP